MSAFRFSAVAAAAAIASATLASAPAAADPWTAAGPPSRPAWVKVKAERRLRLLAGLPGIAAIAKGAAHGYFGQKGPGMSVGLVLDDGLYYSQGFGFADAAKTKIPDEFTVFRAGSFSKVITATALLTLIDDPARNMSLSDPADKPNYLPELKYVCPQWGVNCVRGNQNTGLKLSHLVSHTSGLANVMQQTNAAVPVWLDDLKKSWLLFNPGAFGAYSGVGMEGAGLIGQRVSGQPFPAYVKKAVFDPLHMAHSTMDPIPPDPLTAQKWLFSATNNSWSFAQYNQIIGGDDQPMILPAGGLATNVIDMAQFTSMWLSGNAPQVNGHPMLKPSSIATAGNSLFTATTPPPPYCKTPPVTDASGFFYSPCGFAFGFGVGWYVGAPPLLQHNGDEPGLSGSDTHVDQPAKMAATALVSTEPYPGHKPVQPPGLDGGFVTTVVSGILKAGEAADKSADWAGQALAIGVARVLWLSGKPAQVSDLGAFTPTFTAAHALTNANIVAYLNKFHAQVGACSTFRVRGVTTPHEIGLSLQCAVTKDFNTELTVEAEPPHRIAWTWVPKLPTPNPKCVEACNGDEGHCMTQAHSSGERQQCIAEKKQCLRECS